MTDSKQPKRHCKDCPEGINRPAPYPGPRCSTHSRAFRDRSKAAQHSKMVEKTYGISGEEYWRLYEEQGGYCFICRRHNGKTKRLAVDHDHVTLIVRGLLCGPCNSMLAHLRSDIASAQRIVEYLERARDRNMLTSLAGKQPAVPLDSAPRPRGHGRNSPPKV